MRAIKFRAWDMERKEMRKVTLMDWNEWWVSTEVVEDAKHERPRPLEFGERNSFKNEPTDRHILMQYTGLKDKNGNGEEIYEGDIFEFNDNAYARTGGNRNDSIVRHVVEYENGLFHVGGMLLIDAVINDDEAEVIGNIYEHPNLLGTDESAVYGNDCINGSCDV